MHRDSGLGPKLTAHALQRRPVGPLFHHCHAGVAHNSFVRLKKKYLKRQCPSVFTKSNSLERERGVLRIEREKKSRKSVP
jgi:hypothetical protein